MQYFKKSCVLLLVLCLLVGSMPVGTLAAEETETKVVKQQMLLGDDLTMRFYVNIREEHRENGVMNIRVGGRSVSYAVADMTPDADGYYVFSVELSAAEMTEEVTLSLTSGSVNGSLKMSGVWFVSKENYTKIQVDGGEPIPMTAAVPDQNDGNCLTAAMTAMEGAEIGETSTLVVFEDSGIAWEGVYSQASVKAAPGITPIGDPKSAVIDSPISEGYCNEGGRTYPLFRLNCGWRSLDAAAQDILFYVELPAASSELRINGITCNSWSFDLSPAGMQYQYLAADSDTWADGTVSTDWNNTLSLPRGFQGYVRLRVSTAENADRFLGTALTVQDISFRCDRFGGKEVFQKVYSVRDYARFILESNYTAQTKNLVKQMLNYGAKAQIYFGHKTDELANLGYETESAAAIGKESPEVAVNGFVDGISFYSCSMVLGSTLSTRYYFKAPGGIDGYTFSVGGSEVTPVAKNGMFYVEENGITPDRMDTLTTVTVTKGGEKLSVQYSPMYYITRMYNKPSTTQPFKELLLAAAGYFEAAKIFTGVEKDTNIRVTKQLAPLYGTQDDRLEQNPDRGWRLEALVNVAYTDTQNAADSVIAALEYYKDYNPRLCQTYFYLNGYKDTAIIPQEGLDRIQRVFDAARDRGIKLVVRFAYETDMEGTDEASDEIMLAHMPQLKPILERNTDVIHTVEAGFLGAWGEWHSYKMQHDELALLKGILDMVPQGLYVQVRYPRVRNLLVNAEPDNPNLDRMGYHDDSFFGWQWAQWNDGLNPGEDSWEQMQVESPYRPEGGEMFWGFEYDLSRWAPTTGALAIRKMSAFHQSTFSLYHSFIEDGFVDWIESGKGYYSIRGWLTEPITQEWLDSYGIAYDPLWFQNENGESVERTAFEFVRDHLGYRLRALDVTLDGSLACGDALNVSVNLKNTGFSAVFNMQSGFAVLDMDGNVVSAAAAGDPTEWLPADPETNAPLTHNVAASLTLPERPGSYQIAFYVRNSAGTGARLANDLQFMGGYTVLQTVEIA